MNRMVALILVLAIGCSSCFASGPDQKHIAKIKKQVSSYMDRGARVVLDTYDQRKLQGSINEAGPESFALYQDGQSTTLKYADVKKIKAPMDRRTKQEITMAIFLTGFFGLIGGLLSQDR